MTAATAPVAGAPPRLEVAHLSKTFGHTTVLRDAHLVVQPGEIHALVGQNGSGKSTLIKILAGYHAPDRGAELHIDGREVRLPIQPGSLGAAGISFVHQDLGLVEHLSAAENISIGQEWRSPLLRRLDRRREAQVARKLLADLHVELDPATPVLALAPGQRACVAIARAMRSQVKGAGLIILDESTRALSIDALRTFYKSLRQAASGGSSVLVVAHSLQEVMAEADRVTILRDGNVVGAGLPISELSESQIARKMVGRDVAPVRSADHTVAEQSPHVSVRDVMTRPPGVVEFDLARGEVVGLTGPAGGGWEDLPYVLAGATPAPSGALAVDDKSLDLTRPKIGKFLKAGIVLVPARRELQGIASGLTVADNVSLPRIRSRGRSWFSGIGWQRQEAAEVIAGLGVRPADPKLPVGKLSGGNQQKVLFGKWLLGGPVLMILHEPTQGVDVAARQDLFHAVQTAAQSGTSILVVSNDPNELSAICQRVLIVRDGAISATLTTPQADDIVDATYDGSLEVGLQA